MFSWAETFRGKTIYLILFLLLLPLTLVNADEYHDWGDDFAAYLGQAKCMAEGEPYYKTGFIPNAEKPDMKAAPPGWSLLLLPIFLISTPDLTTLHIYVSLWFIAWGMLLFHFSRKFISTPVAFLLAIFICWHPEILTFKSEILSDIPFATLLTLAFLIYQKSNISESRKIIIIGILSGFLGFMRTTGLLIIPALSLSLFLEKPADQKYKITGLYMAISVLTFLSFQYILFDGSGIINAYGSYLHRNWLEEIRLNIQFYAEGWRSFIFLNSTWTGGLLCLIGLMIYIWKQPNMISWYVMGYLLMIFIWPFRNQGFRYLYPIIPLLLFMIFDSLNRIKRWGGYINMSVLTILLSVVFAKDVSLIEQHFKHAPYEIDASESQELFKVIQRLSGKDEVVVFTKARALCYFAGTHTMYPIHERFKKDYDHYYQKYRARWFISTKIPGTEVYNEAYEIYIKSAFSNQKPVWENKLFAVYIKT